MYIHLKKEYIDDIYRCIEENMNSAATIINAYVSDDLLAAELNNKFEEIFFYLKRAYNPELLELKRQTRLHHKKWLRLKKTSDAAYLKFLKLKGTVDEMEIPF